jgi:hypothetical protein
MIVDKKMIKILTRGSIRELHGVSGPILNPFMKDVKSIARMLKEGVKVNEVLLNKKEIELNMENYNTFHDIVEDAPVIEPVLKVEDTLTSDSSDVVVSTDSEIIATISEENKVVLDREVPEEGTLVNEPSTEPCCDELTKCECEASTEEVQGHCDAEVSFEELEAPVQNAEEAKPVFNKFEYKKNKNKH